MTRFLILLPLILCSCVENQPMGGTPVTGSGIAKVRVHADAASSHVAEVTPRVSGDDRVHLQSAEKHIQGVKDGADEAERGNNEAARQIRTLSHENSSLKTTVKAYTQRWIGDKTFKWARIIIGGAIAAWLALGILGTFFAPAGIGKFILNLLPVSNVFAYLARRKG